MKLHTSLTDVQVSNALHRAQSKGNVTPDVFFSEFGLVGSRSHDHGFEIQLGTYNPDSLPEGYKDQYGKTMRVRKFKNSGGSGASSLYAGTYHEHGWFLAEVFAMDPDAMYGPKSWGYNGEADFHAKTKDQYRLRQLAAGPENYGYIPQSVADAEDRS